MVERLGNALPDPVFIFIWLIAALVVVSTLGETLDWQVVNPVTGELLRAQSLASEGNVRKLFTEMARTYTGFAPLGLVLTIVLGAGVAERSGLMAALLQGSLARAPARLLIPATFLIGLLSTHAVDAAILVYVPLAAVAFAGAGRHPIVGLVAAFSGCGTGLAGNLAPGQYDVLILGITQTAARLIDPQWTMNPLGNWWFIVAVAVSFTLTAWVVIERVVVQRLGVWVDGIGARPEPLTPEQRRGLAAAGAATLVAVLCATALVLWPGYAPLYDGEAAPAQRLSPLFQSLAALIAILFFVTGWAYGAAAGTIRSHRDVVEGMVRGLEPMLPYLVLVFFAAHFVAMIGWSNLGPILAVSGADVLRSMNAPPALMLPALATASAWLDFLIASGSAKWAAVSPAVVPMLMLLGISPEMSTAAYRIGDTVTNLISPLNPYVVLTLIYCRRWVAEFQLGALIALLLPLAMAFYVVGIALTVGWIVLDLPVGPGATVAYSLPAR
ncbi:AbgT family transporter [uncultured Phenylobacterium sp.]|uniref:AbgT family transporter n=1 Tax=uncultured Phenylobacterium sp. TaxID=349273 RepID=UPI0025F34C30|nr:AbgT family transporter [uncultured Phenylobacterium sp.]